jgi:glyoxylase-like metal-dependent hydrolase (beta-lactamase superfamily II)
VRVAEADAEVLALSDLAGPFPVPASRAFPSVPAAEWPAIRHRWPSAFAGPDVWHARIGVHLVRAGGETLLIDTGIGPLERTFARSLGRGGELPQRLAAAGVAPAEVTIVLLTHLHADHVGWSTTGGEGAEPLRPFFPGARYLVHARDLEMARARRAEDPVAGAYVDEAVTPLTEAGVLETFSAGFELADGVTVAEAPGHTPGHVVVRVGAGPGAVLLLGDAFAHPLQLAKPDCEYLLDMDVPQARQTRHALAEQIRRERPLVSAAHFPSPGLGAVEEVAGELRWRPSPS